MPVISPHKNDHIKGYGELEHIIKNKINKLRLPEMDIVNSRVNRSVVVFGNEPHFPQGFLIGTITDGNFYPSNKLRAALDEEKRCAWEVLKQLKDEPVDYIKQRGKATGKCLVCGHTLTDPKSIEVGIGPVCLSKIS